MNSDILKKVGAYHSASRSLDEKAGRIHSSSVVEKSSEQVDEGAEQDVKSERESDPKGLNTKKKSRKVERTFLHKR